MTDVSGRSSSVFSVIIGGRAYPARTVKNCYTCQSPYRRGIELALLKGYSYSTIARTLPEEDEDGEVPAHRLTAANIASHVREGHFPTEEDQWRKAVERRADELGLDISESLTPLVDHVLLGRLVVQKAVEALAEGHLQVDLKDALGFARLMAQMEQHEQQEAVEGETASAEAFMVYWQAIREVCGPELAQQVAEKLGQNPTLKTWWVKNQPSLPSASSY